MWKKRGEADRIRTTTARGADDRVRIEPDEAELAQLLDAALADDGFVIVDRPDGGYAQAARVADSWVVEHRAGGPETHLQGFTDDPQVVLRVLHGFGYGGTGWEQLVDWEPLL